MPTFQSIGLHPDLHKRIVSVTAPTRNDGVDGAYHPVETPLALLSRHAASICVLDRQTQRIKSIGLSEVNQLRKEIAIALVDASASPKFLNERSARAVSSTSSSHAESKINDDSYFQVDGTMPALDLLREEIGRTKQYFVPMLTTGSQQLDRRLSFPLEHNMISTNLHMDRSPQRGGIPFGYVTHIAGRPGSGKTQVALQVASSPGLHSTWFLTSKAASVASLARRLVELNATQNKSIVLDRTYFLTVQDEFQVLARLHQLHDMLQSQALTGRWKPFLLVLDAASGCLSAESDVMLSTVALTLKRLARQFCIAVIVTNSSVSSQQTGHGRQPTKQDETLQMDCIPVSRRWKPALGRKWLVSMDICIWLEAEDSLSSRRVHHAVLERHPAWKCSPGDPICHASIFTITSGGIVSA